MYVCKYVRRYVCMYRNRIKIVIGKIGNWSHQHLMPCCQFRIENKADKQKTTHCHVYIYKMRSHHDSFRTIRTSSTCLMKKMLFSTYIMIKIIRSKLNRLLPSKY